MKKAPKSVTKSKAAKPDPDLVPLTTLDKEKKAPRKAKLKVASTTGASLPLPRPPKRRSPRR